MLLKYVEVLLAKQDKAHMLRILSIGKRLFGSIEGNRCRFFQWITKRTRGKSRKSNALQLMLLGRIDGIAMALGEQLILRLIAPINGAEAVDDVLVGELVATAYHGLAG